MRAVAVFAVLLCHHALLNSGWLGVDLFFVLSGYLITTILRRTRHNDSYWRSFWIKRATRILPPFLILLAYICIVDRVAIRLIIAYLLTLGDISAYLHQSMEVGNPLWSLAVEEHFYMLWPFAVHRWSRRTLLWLLGALIVLEPLLRFIVSIKFHHDWGFIYFLTAFRLDGIALGSLLALLLEKPVTTDFLRQRAAPVLALCVTTYIGLRITLHVAFTRDGNTPIYNAVAYSLVALCSFWLIAFLLTHPRSIAVRVLSLRPLVFLGSISYGIYLYQLVVRNILMRATHLPMQRVVLLTAIAVTAISYISFKFVEQPLIRWGRSKADHPPGQQEESPVHAR